MCGGWSVGVGWCIVGSGQWAVVWCLVGGQLVVAVCGGQWVLGDGWCVFGSQLLVGDVWWAVSGGW